MPLLERLTDIRRKLLIAIAVLLGVVIVLIAGLAVVGFFFWSADSRLAAKIKKNRIGMEFMPVAAGTFMMGSEAGRSDEKPVHQVTISKGFLLGRYEVSAGEWQAVMGHQPNNYKGDKYPAQFVTWNQAQEFVQKLNQMNDGYTYRLPTEAEWEYACRAGTTGEFADELDWIAWYDDNSDGKVRGVGYKHPNAWGLYDMEGNVTEYCQDWYSDTYYSQSPGTDPQGPANGQKRVERGGSYSDRRTNLRAAARNASTPDTILDDRGFRLVAVPR